MCVEILIGQIDDSAGNTGAMITASFEGVDQICPDKACLNTAAALLKTKNVSGAQYRQTVHDRQHDIQQSRLWLKSRKLSQYCISGFEPFRFETP